MCEQAMVQEERSPQVWAPATLRLLLAAAGDGGRDIEGLMGHVLRDRWTAARVGAVIAGALRADAGSLASARPHALASAWPARLAGGGRPAAALLWAAARRPESVFRRIEARFAEDLERAASAAWLARMSEGGEAEARGVW